MNRKITCFFLAITMTCCAFCGCQESKKAPESSFFLMDTVITVRLYTDEKTAEPIFAECRAILSELDSLWSRQKVGSDVEKINASESGGEVDERTANLLRTASEICEKTNGAFDVTVAPLCDLWQKCGEENRLPDGEETKNLLANVGSERISVDGNTVKKADPAVAIDLGGIGKGAAMTAVMEYLKTTGIAGGLVTFGSNVAVFGEKSDGKPYQIGLKNPQDGENVLGVLTMTDGQILSVTGDYERYVEIQGKKYHHVLDPKTGYPSESGLTQVAVICSDGAAADALSTALFVMGIEKSMELYRSGEYDFEAIFVGKDGTITQTEGMESIFTLGR